MGWMEFILGMATLVLGTGWIFTYRSFKRKNSAEAAQAEADGWSKQQEVYQTTIEDQRKYYEHLKSDFNVVMEENTKLRKENNELRDKINTMEQQMFEFKKEISRLGRRVEALSEKKQTKQQ